MIDTPLGKAKIVEYDTPKEELLLRVENGKSFRVPLKDMTASEAACKKSEELGCACRPDTVTRAVLDKLDSPDIQMALAELDRDEEETSPRREQVAGPGQRTYGEGRDSGWKPGSRHAEAAPPPQGPHGRAAAGIRSRIPGAYVCGRGTFPYPPPPSSRRRRS